MSTKKEWLILIVKTLIRVLIGTVIAFVVLKLIVVSPSVFGRSLGKNPFVKLRH